MADQLDVFPGDLDFSFESGPLVVGVTDTLEDIKLDRLIGFIRGIGQFRRDSFLEIELAEPREHLGHGNAMLLGTNASLDLVDENPIGETRIGE